MENYNLCSLLFPVSFFLSFSRARALYTFFPSRSLVYYIFLNVIVVAVVRLSADRPFSLLSSRQFKSSLFFCSLSCGFVGILCGCHLNRTSLIHHHQIWLQYILQTDVTSILFISNIRIYNILVYMYNFCTSHFGFFFRFCLFSSQLQSFLYINKDNNNNNNNKIYCPSEYVCNR